MRAAKSRITNRVPTRARQTAAESTTAQHASELMALAVEAAQSRHLPDFLQRFTERSMHMLRASWCGVAVFRGRETEIYLAGGSDASAFPLGTSWLIERARELQSGPQILRVPKEFGSALESPGLGTQAVL